MERVDKFWNRVTDGMRVDQLWKQFQIDARTSYRLYSKDVDSERVEGVSKGTHFLRVAGQFFWAFAAAAAVALMGGSHVAKWQWPDEDPGIR